MITVVGTLVTALGLAQRRELDPDLRLRTRSWSSSAHDLRLSHETPIPLNIEHDDQLVIGEIVNLFRHTTGDVYAVAVCPRADRLVSFEGPLYFSGEFDKRWRDDGDIRIVGAAITEHPATVSAQPITILPGGLESRGSWSLNGIRRHVVDDAILAVRERRRHRGAPITIRGEALVAGMRIDHLAPVERMALLDETARPRGAAHHGRTGTRP